MSLTWTAFAAFELLCHPRQAAHGAEADSRMGVDVVRGEAGDMAELGIYESFRVRQQVRFGTNRYGIRERLCLLGYARWTP